MPKKVQDEATRPSSSGFWIKAQTGKKSSQKVFQHSLLTPVYLRDYVSYNHPGCHRTSNLVDRLMNRLTRFLYHGRGIHGHQPSSELRLRGWALLNNFRPFAPRSGQVRDYQSPAHRLNQKRYHHHWLHNLQVCASCQGRRALT